MSRGLLLLLAVSLHAGEKYKGPVPPKPDLPYLLHAETLAPTEAAQATEDRRKKEIVYYVSGATSPARTPLASPIFLLRIENLTPEQLQLYRFDVKNGRREVVFAKKQRQRPISLSVKRVGDQLYRLEVDQTLENGEYGLSPSESNQVFCFEVY